MKKLVIKTAVITLLGIICALFIAFGVLTLTSPKLVGNIGAKFNNYKMTVSFYQKQYEKTQDIEDLYVLVNALDADKSPVDTQNYSKLLLEEAEKSENADFFKKKDAGKNQVKTKNYVASKYVIARYNAKTGFQYILTFSTEIVQEGDYTERNYVDGNPYSSLISAKGSVMSADELQSLKNELESIRYTFSDKEYDNVNADITLLKELIVKAEENKTAE
ncbi:MAG: hypothetical protein IJR66_04175 [Clostridia bacterium]|nr:hypothetical protein [Clostridia bacterium]